MRLIVTGKTQSGKTTALHRLLGHALRLEGWQTVLICDGKGHLDVWRDAPGVTYLGPNQIEAWAEDLERLAEAVPLRFEILLGRGLYEAPPADPRCLVLIDEVQKGTRRKGKTGRAIKNALSTLAEQSAALGDVLIISSQREVNAIPPDVRHNANARLSMLGLGYFFYKTDGQATSSGRVSYITPAAARAALTTPLTTAAPFTPDIVPDLLGRIAVEPTRAPTTLYLGEPGSGKTHALRHHPNGITSRHIYADFSQPHRTTLTQIIENAGAVIPYRVTVPELTQIAALAVQAEPTLLLLDNVDLASAKALPSIERLTAAAAAVALTANTPRTPAERRKLETLYPRCELRQIKPLPRETARRLLWQTLDRDAVKKPATVEAKVLAEARGNPGTVVKLARRIQRGDMRELREIQSPVKQINIGWLVVVAVVAMALVSRRIADSYVALLILTMIYLALRPFIYRMMRDD